jgi:hypothetical protein
VNRELAFLAVWIRHRGTTAARPANTNPLGQLLLINMPGQHQQPGSNQIFTPPANGSQPGTSNHTGTLRADIVTALRYL